MPPKLPPNGVLLQSKTHTVAGRVFDVDVYSSPTRRTGRRAVVREGLDKVFDTGNCYDVANCTNSLNEFFTMCAKVCAHCGRGQADANFVFQAQDMTSNTPICDGCAAKALGPTPAPTAPRPEPLRELGAMVAAGVPAECPY